MNKDITTNLPLNLRFEHSESSLRQFFEERLARPVSLVLTGNSTSMLSARIRDGILLVRLHRLFVVVDSGVLDEIVEFLKSRRAAMPRFRKFIRDHREELAKKRPNRVFLVAQGKFHDLRELYDEINARYFGGAVTAAVTWGTSSARGAVRKRTLGSYSERSNTIRINPVLDRRPVPRYYVAFVVYHEMLHAALGISRASGRRSVHSPEFRRREKLFHDYDNAVVWERGR
ncbi:MAG: SprT-like domain-containing protein [Nitrospirota bacterium]|nr:SprT-like domain-containing protein [Nitrospirota bacterium]